MKTPQTVQAKELMIGNYLNYDTREAGEAERILPTQIDWQDLKWISEDPVKFNQVHSPIPLTEKWLEDLGFKLTYNSDMRKTYDLEVNNTLFEFVFPQDGGRTKFRASSIVWDAEIFVPYVHTLQNFVFAFCKHKLTGTHLQTQK